jgi:uncharacterized damage-inducible protein DinB
MPNTAETVHERIARTNKQLLTLASDLSEEQFERRLNPHAPSVRFHAWHVSRWSDTVQSSLPRLTPDLQRRLGHRPQVWAARGLAAAWGVSGRDLGGELTGMGLGDDEAAALPLPSKDKVLAYTRDAFAAVERALSSVQAADYDMPCRDWAGRDTTVAGALVHHLIHINRHLGMIEALRGVMGLRGTATA